MIVTDTYTGEAIQVGETVITPVNQVFTIKFPGFHGGLIWNRPKAVVVTNAAGEERTLPIIDVTRVAIWAMLGGGLLGAIVMGLLSRHR